MISEDPKIQQLYTSLQFCIKSLDQILLAKKKQAPYVAQKIIIKQQETCEFSPKEQELKQELEELKTQHEQMLVKLMKLRKKLMTWQLKYSELEEEFEAQTELLKQYKITRINPKYLELPREDINLYKAVKTYIGINQSKFTLFLKSLIHDQKEEKFLNLDQLLNSIQDYYKNQQMYQRPKFSINSVDRTKLPSLEIKYFTNRHHKYNSNTLEQETKSLSFA